MGKFKRNKTYTLTWDEGEFEGLEVVVKALPVGKYLALMEAFRGENAHEAAVSSFADFVLSWNLDDENEQPVPVTREGVLSVDLELMTAVIKAWSTKMSGSDVPKEETSTAGLQLVEASMPMETLSESRAI